MIIVLTDQDGSLPCCAGCGGQLRPWGYARARSIRGRSGEVLRLRPRRVRCAGCNVTHVLLPAHAGAPRRADAIEVIGSALLASIAGQGHRRIAADLGRPAATVRGWIRRATVRAQAINAQATSLALALDPLPSPMRPAGSPLADALEALGTAIAAARRRLGPLSLAATITGGLLARGG